MFCFFVRRGIVPITCDELFKAIERGAGDTVRNDAGTWRNYKTWQQPDASRRGLKVVNWLVTTVSIHIWASRVVKFHVRQDRTVTNHAGSFGTTHTVVAPSNGLRLSRGSKVATEEGAS